MEILATNIMNVYKIRLRGVVIGALQYLVFLASALLIQEFFTDSKGFNEMLEYCFIETILVFLVFKVVIEKKVSKR